MSTPQRRSWRSAIEVGVLALVAYVPLLLNARGAVAADTKLYLTLDPSQLLGDAAWTWDTRQFGGWVPHQVVGYLWPAGPWYWFAETIHLADWVAQRLWVGTLLFAAGTGVRWAARRLGFGARATAYVPITAAFVYMLSPYVLPYISRTSVLLAPWAGLGWLIGLTVLAARNGGWRHPALFALIIATIGGSNGTALVMIAPAPILYLLDAGIRREVPWRRALGAGARIGLLAALVSVWWAAGVYIQGRYGADVLAYSETVQSTSYTSSAPEVLRGLGYWLFYVRDVATATTSASGDYQTSTALITWGWMLLVAGFAGIALLRWRARSFAALCVLAGVVLAVGVHPLDDASPLMRVFADHPRSSLVLALRSSSRAVPVSLFGLALGAAVGAGWIATRWRRWGVVAPVALVLLAGLNVPAMRSRAYVDAALLHDEAVPAAWRMAAADLDAAPGDGAVLLLPGVESAAYRWGYTVDPVLPGISDRDLLTRDWLPLGSAPLMDVLYALDDRFQEGTVEAAAIAPIARLLGADTIMIANDTAFERFRSVRPEQAWGVYTAGVPGLGPIIGYGKAVPNNPAVPVIDEAALLVPGVGEPMPPVALAPVESAPGRARAASGPLLLVAGSGDGLIDAAAAGLIDGVEVVAYTGALDDDLLGEQLGAGAGLIVTDSNRDRAHHWRNAQDVTGFTEAPGTELLTDDPFDQRLPVLPDAGEGDRTVAEQRGPVTAQATSYGEPNGYRPEDRPFMAIDGDPTTAWVTADRAQAVGEAIEVSADEPVTQITLTQPDAAEARRWITGVRVITDDGTSTEVELGPESRSSGQVIELPAPTTTVRVEITETNLADSGFYPGENAVGFAEVDLGLGPSTEVFVMPGRALQAATPGTPLDIVMTRARVDPTHRWRSDPEPALSREFELAQSIDAGVTVTARLSPRAADDVLAALAGANPAVADRRISGPPVATGWQAFDGDPDTAWITPFETPTPSTLTVPLGPATTIDHLRVTTRTGPGYAQPATFEIAAGGETRTVDAVPGTTDTYDLAFPALTGDALSITIVATDGTTTIDRRLWEPVALPVAVSEVSIDGVAPVAPPAALDTGCRSDLLAVDGVAVPIQVTGVWSALAAGAPAQVTLCGPASTLLLSPGAHLVTSTPGASTGIDIDRVVLGAGPPPPAQTPIRVVNERGRVSRTVHVAPCATGCWLLQGEGWNPGWKATLNGDSLGRPVALGGGMNAWWLEPSNVVRNVELRWTPQWLLWAGLAISAAAVLVCIGLAVAPVRRRRRPRDAPLPAEEEVVDPAVDAGPRVPPRTADWVAAVVTLAAGMLVVGVAWGLICGVVMAVAAFLGRRWIGPAVAVALVALTGVYIVAHENEERFGAGFGWVGEFGEAHQPALAAVVLLVGSVAAAEWARQREARQQEAEAVI